MAGKKRWIIRLTIFTAVVALACAYYYGAIREEKDEKPASYSVILYQNMDNEWAALLEGVKQAEEDYKVKVNYITMETGDTAQEQINIIQREAEAGADGILLAAVNSREAGALLDEQNLQIPVLTVETGVECKKKDYANISADNYKMGQELGEKILEDMEEESSAEKVTIIKEYLERDSVKSRYEGLVDTLENAGKEIQVETVCRQEGDFSLRLFMGTIFHTGGQYIAALDKFCTEEAAAAWEANRSAYEEDGIAFKIYGIGNTAQTVNDLDHGRIQALVYQNEFNMGYEGIRALVEKDSQGYFQDYFAIKHKLVTRDTLYDPENERILFPSI